MITAQDIIGRKMVGATHVDMARGDSMWMGGVEGFQRISVANGSNRSSGRFQHWYVDGKQVRSLDAAVAVLNGEMTLEAAMVPEQKPPAAGMVKISLDQQIDEVDRELRMRARVYPTMISRGQIKQSAADKQLQRLQAVLATLQWLRANESDIRTWVAAKAEARKQAAPAGWSRGMKPIPIATAKAIATEFGYHQVLVIARAIGEGGREHVTTFGVDAENCAAAARIGDFLKFEVMRWTHQDTHEDRRYEALTKAIENAGAQLALVDAGMTLHRAAVTADDPKREILTRIGDLQKEVRDIMDRLAKAGAPA